MSYKVVREVLEHSKAEGADRLVLLAIADVAYHDGVGWLPQGPETAKKSIAAFANCSERQVRRSVDDLQNAGELEIRRVQQGRKRKLIYRIVVGNLLEMEVDYERLNFAVADPFSTPAELTAQGPRRPDRLSGGQEGEDADPLHEGAAGAEGGDDRTARPVVSEVDDRTSAARRPDSCDRDDRTSATGRIENGPEERSSERSLAAAKSSSSTSKTVVDSELARALREARIAPDLRAAAMADPERAGEWLRVARREATSNVAGFFASGFRSGEWPAPRGSQVSAERRHGARLVSLRNFVAGGLVAEAHELVDDWSTLTQVERNEYHSLVEELVAEQLPEAPALEHARGVA
jgi:hypothetical protein